ncbi:cell wall-binding repeat-containing protein [Litchfieldia alkalitelluris]|uniref:cell wall-binding repeat-containing protein n=1 Tax=Litchfieldia alkalitelluris TaxID=304268 RepID=UPI0009972EB7|nr:cell wall-binding repeat-containing protein [Litchfieldia alkalitelluris]
MKRSLALLLVFLMVFSNTALAAVKPVTEPNRSEASKQVKFSELVKEQEQEKQYKLDDKVRVIVEVDGEPAITYATNQGVKYSELAKNVKEKLEGAALKAQQTVKDQLKSKAVKMEFKESFTTAFNGFSGVVEFGKIESIKKLNGVSNVTIVHEYERPEQQPDMRYSKELVEAQKAWAEYGYTGQGMTVGIIDTGVDPSHKDMVLTDASTAELSEAEVSALVAENDLPGKFFTDKVPYGYNYMDQNDQILDLGPGASHHGMHVAGTVGANGDDENGGIKGVAPEAQLLALKVFGNDPNLATTWGDIYVKAIDDSIKLGVDVLNLSLGSTASFVSPEDPEQKAVARAVENGVLMSISAGNSAHFGNGEGTKNPYPSNPDIGVVGAPGLSYDSLQVASLENLYIDLDAVTYSFDGVEEGLSAFLSASSVHPFNVETKTFEVLSAGLGGPNDFDGQDFTGKYALIKRGSYPFVDKTLNAQAAGAAGVIIYNHLEGYVSMATDANIKIPQLFMLKADGDRLKAAIDNGTTVTLTFKGESTTSLSPTGGQMSGFTSWGVTPNLDFKPEITAPGGNILSTLQDNQYGTMSGTSMAAPHVSGGSAIVLQRVDEEFGLEGKDRVLLAKNILMNTAKAVTDQGQINTMFGFDIPYSPRRQGAGLMQLHAALSTPVVVTEKTTGEAKVALKEIGDTVSFTLEATNFSDTPVSYDVAANVQTDLSLFGELGYALNGLEAQPLEGVEVTINGGESTVEVPANGTATITVELDLTNAQVLTANASGYLPAVDVFTNGYFAEGFVTLTNNDQVLSVPYVGFKGDWNAAPVLDEMIYDEKDSFYGISQFVDSNLYTLGADPVTGEYKASAIAISPNNDGLFDEILPVTSFLRNAKEVTYSVLDAEGNKLRTIRSEQNVRKHYYDGGRSGYYSFSEANAWDGTVKNKTVADGTYIYEIAAKIDYPGKKAQLFQYEVVVDTIAPEVNASLEGKTLTFNASDERSALSYIDVLVNGESILETPLAPDTTEYVFAEELASGTEVTVVAFDNAGNAGTVEISGVNDGLTPVINVTSPAAFGYYNTNEVTASGYVTDDSKLAEVTVNGESVDFTYNEEKKQYDFSTVLTLEDGDKVLKFAAKDVAGNEISFTRTVFVDTTFPTVDVEVPAYVDNATTSVTLTATLADNAEELRYSVDGSEEFFQELPGYQMNDFETVVETELTLEPGDNTFNLELVDLVGNKTTKEVKVYRAESESEEQVSRLFGQTQYDTSVEISNDGWDTSDVVVLARGDHYADALAGVPLAAKYDAPLLLTRSNKLETVTSDELKRLQTKKVYILGGPLAISADVEKAITDLGVEVERIGGQNHYDTAALIAKKVAPEGAEKVVVVSGEKFQDALSVAPYAGADQLPILLVKKSSVPNETKAALETLGAKETFVIGGNLVVSEEVSASLPTATRIAGATTYETNVAVANHFGFDPYVTYVATGQKFQDGLSGAALAAKNNTGVVLVTSNSVPKVTEAFLASNNAGKVRVLGGPLAVSDSAVTTIAGLVK